MKVLLCHNFYQQPGGEDQSFAEEGRLLESRGHEVLRFTRHNDAIKDLSSWNVAWQTLWSRETARELRALIRRERPVIMHCTNTFPLISPSAYYAARQEGVAVVQSLRNYRLLCPGAYLMRDGKVCEDCLSKRFAWPAIAHRCYRGSRAGSAVVASMLTLHRCLRTWTRTVDRYFALTQFSRNKFVEGGFPAEKIDVKPNFLFHDPGPGPGSGGYALFVGRLSPEKGVDLLLEVWSQLVNPPLLKIVGDGPLAEQVQAAAVGNPKIEWVGRLSTDAVLSVVGEAACLIQPSLWYEGFPRTILEALARGTPVIASRLGSMAEIVKDGETGLLAEPAAAAFRQAVQSFFAAPQTWANMRLRARSDFEARFSADRNYQLLMGIYTDAVRSSVL